MKSYGEKLEIHRSEALTSINKTLKDHFRVTDHTLMYFFTEKLRGVYVSLLNTKQQPTASYLSKKVRNEQTMTKYVKNYSLKVKPPSLLLPVILS